MRKVLSFVLVLAMILGTASMAFAASSPVAEAATPFDDATADVTTTVLRDLNVLQGDEGKVNLDSTITRAEICAILMRVLGFETLAATFEKSAPLFKDVKATHWANGYINLAYQLGYVDGIGGGKFNPDGKVTYEEGVAFIMKALGYNDDVLKTQYANLNWPYNYLFEAQKTLEIVDGTILAGTVLTRAQLFEVLYNAIDLKPAKWNLYYTIGIDGTKTSYFKRDEGTKTLGEIASGIDEVRTTQYTTKNIVIKDETQFANTTYGATLLADYAGKTCNVLVKGGKIYAILGVASNKLTGTVTRSAVGAITFAGITVTNYAIFAPYCTGLRNGTTYAVSGNVSGLFTVDEILDKTYFDNKETVFEAEVEYNKYGEIATIASISYWKADDSDYVFSTKAAASLKAGFASTVGFYTYFPYTSTASVKTLDVVFEGAATKAEDVERFDEMILYKDANGKVVKVLVVRNNFTAVYEGYTAAKMFFNGVGYKYETAARPKATQIGSTFAVYLNNKNVIFNTKNVDIDENYVAPTPTTGYALIASMGGVQTWKVVDATNNTIAAVRNFVVLYDLATGKELTFDNLSVAAARDVKYGDLVSSWTGLVSGVESETLYEYLINAKGKLESVEAAKLGKDKFATEVAVGKNGLTLGITDAGVKLYPYASDLSVVSADGFKVVAKDLAWLKTNVSFAGIVTIKNGFVTEIIATDAKAESVEAETEETSFAAVVYGGIDATDAYSMLFTGSDKLTKVYGKWYDVNEILVNVTVNEDGEFVAPTDTLNKNSSEAAYSTATGLKFVASGDYTNIVTKADNTYKSCKAPVIWLYSAEDAEFSVFTGTVAEAAKKIADGQTMVCYDTTGDGYINFIIVYTE